MKINETTIPSPRRFAVELIDTELEEVRIAFLHMLSLEFYCNDQRDQVKGMLDTINRALVR